MAGQDNGAADNLLGLSPEQVAQLREGAMEGQVAMAAGLILALAPGLEPSMVEALIRAVMRQQESADFNQILEDATDPKKREECPDWGFMLLPRGKNPRQERAIVTVRVPKDPEALKNDADAALRYATHVGLVTSPIVRGLLLAMGWEVHFRQWKPAPLVSLT